jgi:cytochrome c oxidase cbb3-type subunit 3
VTLLTDPTDLAAGKEIFQPIAACHRADGGGQIGPNLTDDQWILGGGIKMYFIPCKWRT